MKNTQKNLTRSPLIFCLNKLFPLQGDQKPTGVSPTKFTIQLFYGFPNRAFYKDFAREGGVKDSSGI